MKTRTNRRASINGVRNILTVNGKDPGYEYRFVNDEGDRIAQFQEMGYEIVSDDKITVGDRRIANPTKEGTPTQIAVGGGNTAFLMRIKKEWYDEDQAKKQSQVKELEKSMKTEARNSADYGKLEIS